MAMAVLVSLGFVACKEDDKLQASLTIESLVGKYKLTALTQETAVTPKVSILPMFDECMRDDLYQLKSDTTGVYIDAGNSCGGGNYEFDFQVTNTNVNLDIPFLQEFGFMGGKVVSWDGKTLVLEAKVKNDYTANIQTTVTTTLVKQNP